MDFDYKNDRIAGYLDRLPNNPFCRITVFYCVTTRSGTPYFFTDDNTIPSGKVFLTDCTKLGVDVSTSRALKFLFEFSATPNVKSDFDRNDPSKDCFIVDFTKKVYMLPLVIDGPSLKDNKRLTLSTIKVGIDYRDCKVFLYDKLNGLIVPGLSVDSNGYIKGNSNSLKVLSFTGHLKAMVQFWSGHSWLLTSQTDLINNLPLAQYLYVGSDEHLQKWFFKNYLNGRIDEQSKKVMKDALIASLANDGLAELDKNRLEILQESFENWSFNKEALDAIAGTPVFQKAIQKSIDAHFEEIAPQYSAEVQKAKEAHDQELDAFKHSLVEEKRAIVSQYEKKELELKGSLNALEGRIKTTTEEYHSLSEKLDKKKEFLTELKESMSILRPDGGTRQEGRKEQSFPIEVYDSHPIEVTDQNVHGASDDLLYEYYLMVWPHKEDASLSYKEFVQCFDSKPTLVPNVRVVYEFCSTIGKANILVLPVACDWYHYEDFVNHGMLDFISRANEDKDGNYVLCLQNINVVPPQSSLQPFFDWLDGKRPWLQGSNFRTPPNLRIFATHLPVGENSLGLPFPPELFAHWNTLEETPSAVAVRERNPMSLSSAYSLSLTKWMGYEFKILSMF